MDQAAGDPGGGDGHGAEAGGSVLGGAGRVERVRVDTDATLRSTASRVELRTRNRTVEGIHDSGVPAVDLGAQGVKLRRKFLGLATPVIGAAAAERLAMDVTDLLAVDDVRGLVPPPARA